MDIDVEDANAKATFTTTGLKIEGSGAGRVDGDSIVIDGKWTFPAKNCSGTIQLRGEVANEGRDLIGELDYFDGCSGQRTKPGTFALRRTDR
jgi:hypothetical protein